MKQPNHETSEELGIKAFVRHIDCDPCLDEEFNKFVQRPGNNPMRVISEVNSWIAGWHTASQTLTNRDKFVGELLAHARD